MDFQDLLTQNGRLGTKKGRRSGAMLTPQQTPCFWGLLPLCNCESEHRQKDGHTLWQRQTEFIICPMLYAIAMRQTKTLARETLRLLEMQLSCAITFLYKHWLYVHVKLPGLQVLMYQQQYQYHVKKYCNIVSSTEKHCNSYCNILCNNLPSMFLLSENRIQQSSLGQRSVQKL